MDLGLSGRKAIVCASTSGLGLACATALAAEGATVVINGRDESRLKEAAESLGAVGTGDIVSVQADITTPEGREKLLAAVRDPDILVNNNHGPNPGGFFEVTDEDLQNALTAHYWAPIALVRALVPGMRKRKFGRIVTITSAMVAAPRYVQAPSAGARTGFTAIMKGLAREVAQDGVTINQILPERVLSNRQRDNARRIAATEGITVEEALTEMAAAMPPRRMGEPSELGAACAFLCSVQAGYINGTNLKLDGGNYFGLV